MARTFSLTDRGWAAGDDGPQPDGSIPGTDVEGSLRLGTSIPSAVASAI